MGKQDDDDKDNGKADAFDHEAESENLKRIGGDDDDDETVVIDEEDDEVVDRTVDDDPEDEEGKDKDAEPDDEAEKKPKSAFQSRIDRLTARAKAAEERVQELEETVGDREERLGYAQRSGAVTAKAGVEGEIAQIESAMEAAIEAGNTKDQIKLTKQLANAQGRLEKVEGWLNRNPEPKPGERREVPQREARPKSGADRFAPAARPWYEQNKSWFDDPKATAERAVVQALDSELSEEGFDPASDTWYAELNKRLYAKLPHLKKGGGQGQNRRQQGRQRTAGVDRDSDGPTPRDSSSRTELSTEDRRNMRNFRLDPANDKHVKEYYRQQKQIARR